MNPMTDYLWKAASAWFLGFFPLAEIYVAVPAAVAMGLDNVSVLIWTVSGNFAPALLIGGLYEQMMRQPRLGRWLEGLVSERAQERINRWGIWFVLFVTPWTGIWVMAATARILQMNWPRFLLASFISILTYAVIILIAIRTGAAAAGVS